MEERDSIGNERRTLRAGDVIPLSPDDRRKSPLAVRMMLLPLALLVVGEALFSATAIYFIMAHDTDDAITDFASLRERLERSSLPPSEKAEIDGLAASGLAKLRKYKETRESFPTIALTISAIATTIPLILAALIVRYLLKRYPELREDR